LILRNLSDFAAVNAVYATFFPEPLPPARVTFSVGDALFPSVDVQATFIIAVGLEGNLSKHIASPGENRFGDFVYAQRFLDDVDKVQPWKSGLESHRESNLPNESYKLLKSGLHVQSRSYWAPANIGPYSQAISCPLLRKDSAKSDWQTETSKPPEFVHIAGQIPLDPCSMNLPNETSFTEQTFLSLQHLWRIGRAMNVSCWSGAVAFITSNRQLADADFCGNIDSPEQIAVSAWKSLHEYMLDHQLEKEHDEEASTEDIRPLLPDFNKINFGMKTDYRQNEPTLFPILNTTATYRSTSPCYVVEVCELPKGARIEWSSMGIVVSGAHVYIEEHSVDGGQTLKIWNIHIEGTDSGVAWVGVRDIKDVHHNLTHLRTFALDPHAPSGLRDRFWPGLWTIYTTTGEPSLQVLMKGTNAQIIPCSRVWGDGMELHALATVKWAR
jgi:diphthine-ammonia ligase